MSKMNVSLVDYTGCGSSNPARHAANVLVFTKSTRLQMSPGLFAKIEMMDDGEIERELIYMANTIPSSWEFVNYTFLITAVTRGFTHQFVRSREGSYAQQTMRVLNVEGWTYGTGPSVADDGTDEGRQRNAIYVETMEDLAKAYDSLIDNGAEIEDARGVLPTNIHTNIVAKFNMRTMADLVRKRSSTRTQGEYRQVLDAMKAEMLRVHPWAQFFVERTFDKAAAELDALIGALPDNIGSTYKTKMLKLVDQMRITA